MDTLINEAFISGAFLCVGFVCMALEVFIPTGGVLGFLAIASTGFGIFGLFHQGHTTIAVMALGFFIAAFLAMIRFMMRRLNFSSSMTPESSTSVDRRIADLVGREGITITPLRPSGMATIDGRKVDVVTLGDYIDKDVPVRVVDNSGNRVVVRQAESRNTTT